MSEHPLTPKKAILPAALAGAVAAAVTAVVALVVGILFPPLAWMPGTDYAALADAAFWWALAESLTHDAFAPANALDRIGRVIDLPFAFHRALQSHDLMLAVSARAAGAKAMSRSCRRRT